MGHSALTALLSAISLGLVAGPALADTNNSSNWAGYAIHAAGVKFSKVFATWRQPAATCVPGRPAYSAYWVGLGGYSASSPALEQVGTEVDCSASGGVQSSAWYELVPAASRTIRFRVRPGDLLAATVAVHGRSVVMTLYNATTHRRFRTRLGARRVDVTSAEWIVEAPSDCFGQSSCQTLPLADFGSASFGTAYAVTASGHGGTIADSAWRTSKITLLAPSGWAARPRVAVQASPSSLSSNASTFQVTYTTVALPSSPSVRARRGTLIDGYLVHPGR